MRTKEGGCPAARLAREAADLADAYCQADEARQSWKVDAIWERLGAIEEAVTWVEPRSTLGAFFQAVAIYARADEQAAWVGETQVAMKEARALRRLAASLARYVEVSADAAMVERLRAFYMDGDKEPLATMTLAA